MRIRIQQAKPDKHEKSFPSEAHEKIQQNTYVKNKSKCYEFEMMSNTGYS